MHGQQNVKQNRKNVKFVTPYQRELLKKIPRLSTFGTQSLNEGLIVAFKTCE
jgi:hypothetical protein